MILADSSAGKSIRLLSGMLLVQSQLVQPIKSCVHLTAWIDDDVSHTGTERAKAQDEKSADQLRGKPEHF